MLKVLFSLLGVVPLLFINSSWHLVHVSFYLLAFMFMILSGVPYLFYQISYFLGCDVISFGLILLSFWICGLMIMASQSVVKSNYYSNLFLFMILFLMIMLYCTFSSCNLFLFYLFFEGSLIPTLFLILGWGYQPERVQAGMYLLFYTLLASLPLLVGIFYIYENLNSLFMPFLVKSDLLSNASLFYLAMIFAFLVKMPMFLVHLWLPKAHVEAPVSGSMILAGVLLKLGGYGLLRVFNLLSMLGMKFNFIWIGISLVGGCLVSFICLRQTDLKALVAYSSVAHMGLVLGGLLTLNYWGVCGAFTLMIAHGLCSSGLFCLTNISYERLGSRSLVVNKGLLNFMPSMALWWFLLSSANMAAPPTLNLLGEISLLNSLVGWSWVTMLMLALLSFFSAAYTLYLFSYSQHGKLYSGLYSCVGGYTREYLLLFLHWVPLNLLILKAEPTLLWI
uniref:NADH-ubiquinone oxidoreductase chain 4 n=1 Tax=Parafronurus youi TaxID=490128 RepID=B6CNL9_9INSE|nr:NADH dehydrogenase subunit 4 [Parafronurus youi]ABY53357.1 NADH dehydrogenase subunit 4 [Parafronurus youi]